MALLYHFAPYFSSNILHQFENVFFQKCIHVLQYSYLIIEYKITNHNYYFLSQILIYSYIYIYQLIYSSTACTTAKAVMKETNTIKWFVLCACNVIGN